MRFLPLIAVAALALAACSSAPSQSAPLACKDFASWQHAQHGSNDSGRDPADLKAAVQASPSGKLHFDLYILRVHVTYAQAHPEAGEVTGAAVQAVQVDCSSVNPVG